VPIVRSKGLLLVPAAQRLQLKAVACLEFAQVHEQYREAFHDGASVSHGTRAIARGHARRISAVGVVLWLKGNPVANAQGRKFAKALGV
jgi:hypothetical protein